MVQYYIGADKEIEIERKVNKKREDMGIYFCPVHPMGQFPDSGKYPCLCQGNFLPSGKFPRKLGENNAKGKYPRIGREIHRQGFTRIPFPMTFHWRMSLYILGNFPRIEYFSHCCWDSIPIGGTIPSIYLWKLSIHFAQFRIELNVEILKILKNNFVLGMTL